MADEQLAPFTNPFRPGAGHTPPHLAGRHQEQRTFEGLLEQETILKNLVLTGIRGVGKTVLLDKFKPIAISKDWLWVGTDLNEAASVSEDTLATRLLADLSVVTSGLVLRSLDKTPAGFGSDLESEDLFLTYPVLRAIFAQTPGLVADKLKNVLDIVWDRLQQEGDKRGVVFAYDEAQNLADQPDRTEFPLALLLDVFQSIQRRGVPFMLALTGLPTLFPKLVEARTYAERMFTVETVDSLSRDESKEAILTPIEKAGCPVTFDDSSVEIICDKSGGYPYFIQFMCREVYDLFIQKISVGERAEVPVRSIMRKLDTDFFAGRWGRATDRQHDLLHVIATLPDEGHEFTIQEVIARSKSLLQKPFSSNGSQVNQMLKELTDMGLVYKNRHGKYSFAVPLFAGFIRRQMQPEQLELPDDLADGS